MALRRGALAALVLSAAAAATPLLPATAASAETDGRLYLVVADRAPHSAGGLFLGPSLDRTDTAVLSEEDGTSAVSVTAARTARRFAAVEYRYDPSASLQERNNTDVVVYDSSGEQVERVASSPINSSSRVIFTGVALSPDGTQVVWSKYTGTSNAAYSLDLYRSDLGSGVTSRVSGGGDLEHPAYLDGTTLIATNHTTGAAVTLPAFGGPPQAVANDPTSGAADYVLSPDGSSLAWDQDAQRDTEDGYRSRDVYTASFALVAGSVSFGPRHQVTSSRDNHSPVWETDSQLDLVISDPGPTPEGAVWTAPADGSSAPTPVEGTPAGSTSFLAIGTRDATPPGGVTIAPISLGGTAATVAWDLPSDPDVAGGLITRSPGGAAPVLVKAPLTRYRDSGLKVGTTYTYTVRAVDRSGNAGPPVSRQMQALNAGAVTTSPTSTSQTGLPFPVTFATGNPSDTTYSVDVSTNAGPLEPWLDHVAGSSRTMTDARAGDTYRFGVTAFDSYGNSTPRVLSRPTVVPFDQSVARRLYNTTTARYADAFGHSVSVLRSAGTTVDVISVGHTLQVIGTRCPGCGSFDVVLDGHRLGTANSSSPRRLARQVLFTVSWSSDERRDVVLVKRPGPWVYLDAFAMTR